ncbi:probable fatty acyl-CoA reductase 4 [Pistacia vera]|uniref:probable fatty acyl-CoA reductase 4 n=1 Tax=Pistacia vera TaxID=55513 RepID=UPI00126321CD|nr:probable fatty acyl-CoA reductase 4 [Pistacia vera]
MEFVNPLQFFKDKTILVIGATGFLGKVFVEKILKIQPNVKKLYLLVRAADAKSAMNRILDEVEKDLFNVLRDKLSANFKSFILEKVVAVVGDVSEVNLGVKNVKGSVVH